MPIYAYKCESCGFEKDVLQKLSDATLTRCPSCAAAAFRKQLTAAGFQLKGSGWYATDFKDGGNKAAPGSGAEKPDAAGDAKTESKPEAKTENKGDSKGDGKADNKADSKAESRKADGPPAKKPDVAPAPGSGA